MSTIARLIVTLLVLVCFDGRAEAPGGAGASPISEARVTLHTRDGTQTPIGRLRLGPLIQERQRFELVLDPQAFRDHFLSMREFKCLEGQGEILCHVPYPYARGDTLGEKDLAWLEHALLFMFKKPTDYGAKLWNGVYWKLSRTERGLRGVPQAIDLNLISTPPSRLDVPPYRPTLRDDMPPHARWFTHITIE